MERGERQNVKAVRNQKLEETKEQERNETDGEEKGKRNIQHPMPRCEDLNIQ